jgi:hypothetical protein
MVVYPSYVGGISRRIIIHGWPQAKVTPYPKITKAKRAESVAQMVEHLPNKEESLNSNLNTSKKRNKKITKTILGFYNGSLPYIT